VQPDLTTARLRLVPVQSSDVDALWALWTYPDVRRYLWDDREISREQAAATVEECGAFAARGLGLWLLIAPAHESSRHPMSAPIGCAGLLPVGTAADHEPRLAGLIEPLVALTPRAWGRGYAQEGLGALLEYAATSLGLVRLAAVTDVPNVASDRMLRRAGFTVLSEVPGPKYRLRTYLWDARR
jgi:RimJ/RimL family protein N-acetyltransferase